MASYSNSKGILLVQVSETLARSDVAPAFDGKPRGTINKISRQIVDELFQTDNWEAIQEYLNERVADELPDRR